MADWRELVFGSNLIKCETFELLDTVSALGADHHDGEVQIIYGIYFSFANIREVELSKKLVQLYRVLCDSGGHGVVFRVVQVVLWSNGVPGAVKDIESSFRNSVEGMPWLAVPLSDTHTRSALARRFGPRSGSASLVLLDSEGRVVSSEARDRLQQDPKGEQFPWKPRPVEEILRGVPLLKSEGGTCKYEELPEDCIRGLYFSAHWCPPCRAFTPLLVDTFEAVRRRHHGAASWQIIFVSSDRSADSFAAHRESMPWLSVPWEACGNHESSPTPGDQGARSELARALGVRSIPALVLIDGEGRVITGDGRGEVTDDPEGQNFPWRPRPVNILTERFAAKMHDFPAIVLFVDEDSDLAIAESVLSPVAHRHYDMHNIDLTAHSDTLSPEIFLELSQMTESISKPPIADRNITNSPQSDNLILFLIAPDSETCDILREFIRLEDSVPLLTAIDIPRGKLAIMEEGLEITEDNVRQFVDRYLRGDVKLVSIKPSDRKSEITSEILN